MLFYKDSIADYINDNINDAFYILSLNIDDINQL